MKSKILLRIAAALLLVHLLGHLLGHAGWDQPQDPQLNNVIQTMKDYEADFMGANRSMADFYEGLSLLLSVFLALSAVVMWLVAGFVEQHRGLIQKVLYPFGAAFLLIGAIEFLYFFPLAAAMSFFAGIAVLAALMSAPNK